MPSADTLYDCEQVGLRCLTLAPAGNFIVFLMYCAYSLLWEEMFFNEKYGALYFKQNRWVYLSASAKDPSNDEQQFIVTDIWRMEWL